MLESPAFWLNSRCLCVFVPLFIAGQMSEALFEVQSHVLETPEKLLFVEDDEVTVERVLNAAERTRKEEAAKKVMTCLC
jgi:hypothetical protein